MKVKINERQYKSLVNFLMKEEKKDDPKKLKYYAMDWDDNILEMPTKIHFEKKVGDKWVPVDLSTAKFAQVRGRDNYRPLDNNWTKAFEDFRDIGDNPESFLDDTKKALRKGKKSPSFKKFKEAMINGSLFSIVTTRGHNPETIKKGVKIVIDQELTEEEKEEMVSNIKEKYNIQGDPQEVINQYLNKNQYYPVNFPEYVEKIKKEKGEYTSEIGKREAIRKFVNQIVNNAQKLVDSGKYDKLSVGFSEDDPGYLEAVEDLLEKQLAQKYPNVRFVIYDTSDPENVEKRRIVVQEK